MIQDSRPDPLRRAVELHQRGDLAEAERLYLAVLAADANHFDALHLLGVVRTQQGRYGEAVALIERALARNPASASALVNLGNALGAGNHPATAVESYRKALALEPDDPVTHCNLGAALMRLKRHDEARASLERALAFKPAHRPALIMLGAALEQLDRHAEATDCYRRVLATTPGDVDALVSLAGALVALNRPEEAIAPCREALERDPSCTTAHDGLGLALARSNRHAEALAALRKAIALEPGRASAHWNLALSLLALGEFREGWREYEWRWSVSDLPRPRRFPQPLWAGTQEIAGRTVLLHAEQGLGDTLQFVRYAPLVAARGARVVLACQKPLERLLGRVDGVARVTALDGPLPDFDLHCPLMSLPLAFGTDLATIPAAVPYLHAEPADAARWRLRVGDDGRVKVGLVWAGSPRADHAGAGRIARRRSVTLAQLAPLAAVHGVRCLSLQVGAAAREAQRPPDGMDLADHTAELRDFADTAALVAALDLVVTVDTAVAHLAGALGKPVWILSRFDASWRWLLDRDDSPWYPTARLYRQERTGDWETVIARVKRDLENLRR